ncbi:MULTISPECIES: hypothetical protein [unclassified Streptomyces]|uniref:hypothetical protein n=1 Tax=unclassified Streptomyces TaxID=2593676 RepID=UPI00081B1B09|nr:MULTISPECIES: hypothetical protein [unclassified Streptomyces]MYQ82187.1 hypothetical protein [Streptomyces sp. SID4936]SCD30057.1 translation initiation factor IF-2 [Streptomyces sp. DvalAA-43]
MTTSKNEETEATSESEVHATAEATGGTSTRTAPATPAASTASTASTKVGGTTGEAKPSTPSEESAEKKNEKQAAEAEGQGPSSPATAEAKAEGEAATTPATAEGEGATATTTATATAEEEAASIATGTATTTADAPEKVGRPNKALLAGAAIAGVLLVTVPFLVHTGGGDDGRRNAGNGEAPGTVLGSGKGDMPGVFASAAPSPRTGSGKQPPRGEDGKGGGPSADGPDGSQPLNEGGGTAGGSTGGGGDTGTNDDPDQKSTDGKKTTTGNTTTNRKNTTTKTGTGSTSTGTGGGTPAKTTPQSNVVYTGVAGRGCPTPAGGGYQQDHFFTDGSAGWYTPSSGGWTGNGCNGSYASIPMSGSTTTDMQNRVKWWWKPGSRARTCQISVYVPNNGSVQYVGGHPTKYHVLVNANDASSMYSSFTLNQTAHRGQWVDAGTFPMKGSTIGVKLLDRGDDWSKGWEKAHHAAAQMKVTCRS